MDSDFFLRDLKWRAIALCFILQLITLSSYGQTGCACPAAGTCGPCTGGLTSLTIKYTGLGATITVSDGGGNLFTGSVLTGAIITVQSSAGAGQLFVGNFVTVTGTLLFSETMATNCTNPVTPGTVYQYFQIVASTDKISGTVCCAPADDDHIPPTFTSGCPANIQVFTASGTCSATVTWTPPVATDNCGAVTLTSNHNPGDTFPLGTTTVTYTATDQHNNTSTCSFTVTVKDNIAPAISSCPVSTNVFVDASCKFTVPAYTATVTDNCGAATLTQSPVAGTVLSGNNTTQLVTLTATDAAGNASSCSFTITLKDNIAPVIAGCPSNISVSAGASSCSAIVNWTAPTVSDNCSVGSFTSNHNSGDAFPVGVTTVTYTAVDGAGNTAACSFTVKVIENVAPVITNCPSSANVFVDASCKFTLPAYNATVTDNCGVATLTQSPVAGTVLSGHNTKQLVTLTATDAAGNTSSCSFTITLKDNIAPTISSCPVSTNVFLDTSCKFTVPVYTATVTDNCGATLTQSPAAGTVLSGNNTTQLVRLTATDEAGNASSCSFTITLKDNIAPAISSCPVSANVFVDASCKFTVPAYTATVTDNCGAATLTQSPVAGTVLSGNNTTQLVTLTATDAVGNASSCSFTITLKDNLAPVIANCPADIAITALPSCDAIATWTAPTVSDNCSTPSLSSSYAPGSTFSFGTTVVTYTATDNAGNTSTCSFTVTVSNNSQLAFSNCPADINLEADETGEATATWIEPTVSTTCGKVTLTSSHTPGSLFQVGTTEVKYVATRNDGVTASCTFNVIVAYRDVTLEVDQLITPNGDGINDKLRVKNLELFKDNDVIIVDRWGSIIYSATGYNNESVAWDGSNKSGAKVPTGTYFYAISVLFNGQRIKKEGFIELLR